MEVGSGGVIMGGQRGPVSSGDWPHTVNVYVSLFILQKKLSHLPSNSFLLLSIQSCYKGLLNLIGRKIWSFCFLVANWCYCTYLIPGISAILHASGLERVREIGPSLNRVVRFLLMTFPLTTGHNMFIDSCLLGPLISLPATQFQTAAWAWGGRAL